MVLVIREEEVDVFARPQGEVFKDQKKAKELFKTGEAEKVKWIDIVIYAKADVDYCYWHHVQGRYNEKKPSEKYTVLKRKNNLPISKEEFIDDINFILETIKLEEGKIDFLMPDDEYAAYTFQEKQNITPDNPRIAKIRFRGIRQITGKQLPKFAKIIQLSNREMREITAYINNSLSKNSGYRIREIWIIEHTDIR